MRIFGQVITALLFLAGLYCLAVAIVRPTHDYSAAIYYAMLATAIFALLAVLLVSARREPGDLSISQHHLHELRRQAEETNRLLRVLSEVRPPTDPF